MFRDDEAALVLRVAALRAALARERGALAAAENDRRAVLAEVVRLRQRIHGFLPLEFPQRVWRVLLLGGAALLVFWIAAPW